MPNVNIWIILILCLFNFEYCAGYKCLFDFDKIYNYTCIIYPETSDFTEEHNIGFNNYDVINVDLDGTANEISHLDYKNFNFCERFQNLLTVTINDVKTIDKNLIQSCEKLEEIKISNTEIEEFPEKLFENQQQLKSFSFTDSKLSTLPDKMLANNDKLTALDLSNNKIHFLSSHVFDESLENLQEINLSNNQISDLPKDFFKPLKNIRSINLNNNQLKTLHSDSFGLLTAITIHLDGNKIYSIDEDCFEVETDLIFVMSSGSCSLWDGSISYDMKDYLNYCFERYRPRDGSPSFVSSIPNTTVTVGQDALLICKVKNLGINRYKTAWIRTDGYLILTMEKHVITRNNRIEVSLKRVLTRVTYQMTIKKVQKADKGWYECKINSDPMIGQLTYLDVVDEEET